MPINKELLERVKQHILEEPRRLNMDFLLLPVSCLSHWDADALPPCGTVGCIAGWATFLTHGAEKAHEMDPWVEGMKILGLDDLQASRLFAAPEDAASYPDGATWPIDLAKDYIAATSPQERAQITADRIDLFVKTDGAK